jgi:hypothetical protein
MPDDHGLTVGVMDIIFAAGEGPIEALIVTLLP